MADWYEEAFRADYLRVYPHRDDAAAAAEVAAWRGALPGIGPGKRVLDLACGAGRHLRAMEAAGIRAVGADLSADLLAEARRRGRGRDRVVRCDMRRLPFRAGAFEGVTCFFTSFGYFATPEEDAAALREAGRVLAAGGSLLLDLADPISAVRDLVPVSERLGGGILLVERRRASPDGRRIEKEVTLHEGVRERRWTESVRLYPPEEIEAMAGAAGLRPAGRFAGHGGGPWRAGESPRCVLLLRKAAA